MLPLGEQTVFADPALDRLMGVVFNLAAELQVLRDRITTLETQGLLDRAALNSFAPGPGQAAELSAESRAFVVHVLGPILHRQASASVVPQDVP